MKAIDPSIATGKAKQLVDAVQAKLNLVPNMTKVMANSPAVLEAYLGFSGALEPPINPLIPRYMETK